MAPIPANERYADARDLTDRDEVASTGNGPAALSRLWPRSVECMAACAALTVLVRSHWGRQHRLSASKI
jgi:hypothetical protein